MSFPQHYTIFSIIVASETPLNENGVPPEPNLQVLVQAWDIRLKLTYRSPRWTSGSPRMLLVLVREFESRRGEISIYLQK